MSEPDSTPSPQSDQGQPAGGQGQPPVRGWGEVPQTPPGYGPPTTDPQQQGQYGQQYGQPQYGRPQYGQPQYGQPQYGQAGGYGPAPSAYRPAPVQRGIIPLRPIGLGEIFDGAFRSIRHNPRVMFGLSAVVVTVVTVLDTLVQWASFGWLGAALDAPVGQQDEVLVGDVTGLLGGSLFSLVLNLVSVTLLQGLLIVSVSRSVLGQVISLADTWQRVKGRLLGLIGLTLVVLALLVVPWFLLAGLVVLAAVNDQPGVAVLVGVVGALGLLVWTVWIAVRTLLSTPALVLEEQKVSAALRRGWRLSRGSFWRLFGIYLLTQVIVAVVAGTIVAPTSFVDVIAGWDPLSDPRSLTLTAIATIVGSLLTTPFAAAVVALLYIDVRMRFEGLDVELTQAAEAVAADPAAGTRT